jgi:hypothetical protein
MNASAVTVNVCVAPSLLLKFSLTLKLGLPSLLLAASWLNVSLYTLELVLCRRYFQRPNRPFLYRLGVSALIFFDTVCTLTICINLCFFLLGLGGDPVALLSPTSIAIFMTYCTAAVEQTILCSLFYAL